MNYLPNITVTFIMFQIEDDFDVDENFLNEVLNCEKSPHSPSNFQGRNGNFSQVFCNITKDNYDDARGKVKKNALQDPRSPGPKRRNLRPAPSLTTLEIERCPRRENSDRIIRARKFPGPAGLLPERECNTSLVAPDELLNELEAECSNDSFKEDEVLSQDTASKLDMESWSEVVAELGSGASQLLKTINVSSVRSKAKQVRALKVPCIVLLLQALDTSTPDPCLYLTDSYGEMAGALHRDVWEQFSEELVPGCVLVLVNVGVVSAGTTALRHYLNITSNNIAAIYSLPTGPKIKVTKISEVDSSNCLKYVEAWNRIKATELTETDVLSSARRAHPSADRNIQANRIPMQQGILYQGRPPTTHHHVSNKPASHRHVSGKPPTKSLPRTSQDMFLAGPSQAKSQQSLYQGTPPAPHHHISGQPPLKPLPRTSQDMFLAGPSRVRSQQSFYQGKPVPHHHISGQPPAKSLLRPSRDVFLAGPSQAIPQQSFPLPAPRPNPANTNILPTLTTDPSSPVVSQTFSDLFPSTSSSQTPLNRSTVESLFDGLDTESLFGEF